MLLETCYASYDAGPPKERVCISASLAKFVVVIDEMYVPLGKCIMHSQLLMIVVIYDWNN